MHRIIAFSNTAIIFMVFASIGGNYFNFIPPLQGILNI